MKHYSYYGFNEFFIALGHKGEIVKRYFWDYYSLNGNMTLDFSEGKIKRQNNEGEDWTVHLIETGQNTNTGGRVKQLEEWLKDDTFMVTYGDGVCDVDLMALLKFHQLQNRIATVTAVRPPARFGGLIFEGDMVAEFTEKPQIGEGWINGGYLVFQPEIFNYLQSDSSSLEADAMERLAGDNQLAAYRHDNFWQCMDTLRDKRLLERLWQDDQAEWKIWK